MAMLKRRMITLGTIATLAIAALAYAYWTGTGTGSGTAVVADGGTVLVTGTVAPGTQPGTSSGVSFTAANATEAPIRITDVHLVSIATDGAHSACDIDDLSMEDVTQNHDVPAGATSEALPNDGSLVYVNTAVNQDACKGATLTLTLSST
ncbi:MAG: hypothetical protein QOI31_1169 [Solirubrobacterales bacterium]|nr:hypothetical protein [Solirubrobacterales bacterium]